MKRTTYKSIISNNSNKNYQALPKLADILVNLSVKSTPKVTRKLRLIGVPIEFVEYSDKKRVTGEKGKTVQVPFPDVNLNSNYSRIGHPDPSQCPWKSLGYVGARKFAQACLEEQTDGSWKPKILCKGPSIFNEFAKWELGRAEENDNSISLHLGGLDAPTVKIQATFDNSKLGDVDYKVFVSSKDMNLSENYINELRSIREPSADELSALRQEYEDDQREYTDLPEWQDFFEYGYDLRRIFKFTPLKEGGSPVLASDAETLLDVAEEIASEEDTSLDGITW